MKRTERDAKKTDREWEAKRLRERNEHAPFEQAILPHLGAAYNLARWLMHNDQDAEDAVQDACLRALRFFDGFHGGDSRAWLLRIVRNTCYTWLQKNRAQEPSMPFDIDRLDVPCEGFNPETILLQNVDNQQIRQALEALPAEFREVMILRELEGLSYREIAEIAEIPQGTVMSRLARARKRLQCSLAGRLNKEW